MNQNFTFTFVVSLCLFSGIAHVASPQVNAPVQAVQTTPHDFALYYVDKSGQIPPQLMMRTDFHEYEGHPSYRTFLPRDDKSASATPEAAVAQFYEFMRQPQPDVEKGIRLYEKGDYQSAEDRDSVRREVEGEHVISQGNRDMIMMRRYDIGNYTFITTQYIDNKGKLFPTGMYFLHKGEDGYRLTTKFAHAVMEYYMIDYDHYYMGEHWNEAPRPQYKYSLRFYSPFSKDPPELHPATVLFNGAPSHTLLNDAWMPTDDIGRFFKRVVQTYRKGSREEYLSLWTETDTKKYQQIETELDRSVYQAERRRFNSDKMYWLFTLDFGPSVAVFFTDEAERTAQIEHLIFWKDKGQLKLTGGLTLPSGEKTFVGNVREFFGTQAFQDAVRGIVKKEFPMPDAVKP